VSGPEDFISRWSRQKRATAVPDAKPDSKPAAVAAAPATAEARATPPGEKSDKPAAANAAPAPFDLASLPSLESISAQTDIRGFLQPGVPPELARAALRRAWSADPAIRDFIGLAENAWDFTAPNSMMGFGPLDPELAKEMFARFIADNQAGPAPSLPDAVTAEPEPGAQPAAIAATDEAMPTIGASTAADSTQKSELSFDRENMVQREKDLDAVQPDKTADQRAAAHPRRGHGSAIPR
jgi:hypothetical protein